MRPGHQPRCIVSSPSLLAIYVTREGCRLKSSGCNMFEEIYPLLQACGYDVYCENAGNMNGSAPWHDALYPLSKHIFTVTLRRVRRLHR